MFESWKQSTGLGSGFPKRGSNYQPLPKGSKGKHVRSHAVVTINATPEEVFNFYQRPELLPLWQEGVKSVTRTGDKQLHWVATDPATGKQMEFDSVIEEVVAGKRHVSRITTGPLAGSVNTALFSEHPSGRGAVFTMIGDFMVPGGMFGNALSKLVTRSPEQMTIENTRHLKQLMETGEIPRVDGQPFGPRNVSGKIKGVLLTENITPPPGYNKPYGGNLQNQHSSQHGATDVPQGRNAVLTSALAMVPVVIAAAIFGILEGQIGSGPKPAKTSN